jgi:peptidoglycan hydrolase CwlO-like protein
MWWTFIWKYKTLIIIAIAVVVVGSYIAFLRVSIWTKDIKLKEQGVQITVLERQNTVLQQNADAIKKQNEALKNIQKAVAPLQNMVSKIPIESKEKLKDANITKANDCIVDYANGSGVLPEGCDAFKTNVPESKPSN